jgi:hypothetical protein
MQTSNGISDLQWSCLRLLPWRFSSPDYPTLLSCSCFSVMRFINHLHQNGLLRSGRFWGTVCVCVCVCVCKKESWESCRLLLFFILFLLGYLIVSGPLHWGCVLLGCSTHSLSNLLGHIHKSQRFERDNKRHPVQESSCFLPSKRILSHYVLHQKCCVDT